MIRLLKWLFFGDAHLHYWVDKDKVKIFEDDDSSKLPIYTKYIKECSVCGTIKVFKA